VIRAVATFWIPQAPVDLCRVTVLYGLAFVAGRRYLAPVAPPLSRP
jgi:hypothetical protein